MVVKRASTLFPATDCNFIRLRISAGHFAGMREQREATVR